MLAVLSTRMFRFAAPGRTHPRVEGLLAFERGWLTGGWAMEKVVSTLAVAPVLGVFCAWRLGGGCPSGAFSSSTPWSWGRWGGGSWTARARDGRCSDPPWRCWPSATRWCYASRGGHAGAGRHGAPRGSIRRDAPRTALLQGPRACLSLVTLTLFTERSGVPVKPPQLVGPGGSYDTYA